MCNFKDGTRAALLKRRLGYGNRPRMSFRGAKRRGNPLNRNANLNGVLPRASLVLAISTAQPLFILKKRGTKLKPQLRASACLVGVPSAQADKRKLIQGALINGMCLFKVRAARRREYERRA